MSELMILQFLAAALFVIGVTIVLHRNSGIILLMGIELILNGIILSLVSFSRNYALLTGQAQVFFILTIAAAESAIGLSILLNVYRNFGTIKTSVLETLKG